MVYGLQTTVFINTEWVSNRHNMNILHTQKIFAMRKYLVYLEQSITSVWPQSWLVCGPSSILHPSCVRRSRSEVACITSLTSDQSCDGRCSRVSGQTETDGGVQVYCPARHNRHTSRAARHTEDNHRYATMVINNSWVNWLADMTDHSGARSCLSWMDHTFTVIVFSL